MPLCKIFAERISANAIQPRLQGFHAGTFGLGRDQVENKGAGLLLLVAVAKTIRQGCGTPAER